MNIVDDIPSNLFPCSISDDEKGFIKWVLGNKILVYGLADKFLAKAAVVYDVQGPTL
jgi:hypothetical protein